MIDGVASRWWVCVAAGGPLVSLGPTGGLEGRAVGRDGRRLGWVASLGQVQGAIIASYLQEPVMGVRSAG